MLLHDAITTRDILHGLASSVQRTLLDDWQARDLHIHLAEARGDDRCVDSRAEVSHSDDVVFTILRADVS